MREIITRRAFLASLAAVGFMPPLTAHAQQGEGMRRIGVLMNRTVDNPVGASSISALKNGLQQLGWSDAKNLRVDVRWGANNPELERRYAAELTPDVIVASGTLGVVGLQRVTRTLPIVFVGVSDPVSAGVVANLAHPGGNTTGFMQFEYSFSGKWVELLKQIVAGATHAAVLRDADNPAGIAQFGAIRSTASSLGVDVTPIDILDTGEIERAIAASLGPIGD